MGRKSRIKKNRRSLGAKFSEGERIWVRDPKGFIPEGIYVYLDNSYGLASLSAGETMIGIDESALKTARKLSPTEIKLPGVTEKDIAHHNLSIAKANGHQECEICRQMAGFAH